VISHLTPAQRPLRHAPGRDPLDPPIPRAFIADSRGAAHQPITSKHETVICSWILGSAWWFAWRRGAIACCRDHLGSTAWVARSRLIEPRLLQTILGLRRAPRERGVGWMPRWRASATQLQEAHLNPESGYPPAATWRRATHPSQAANVIP
jgi:hypothetical protein